MAPGTSATSKVVLPGISPLSLIIVIWTSRWYLCLITFPCASLIVTVFVLFFMGASGAKSMPHTCSSEPLSNKIRSVLFLLPTAKTQESASSSTWYSASINFKLLAAASPGCSAVTAAVFDLEPLPLPLLPLSLYQQSAFMWPGLPHW